MSIVMPVLYDQFNKPIKTQSSARNEQLRLQEKIRKLTASYDASKTTDYNKEYWGNADLRSPDSANSPEVLRKLRARSRYEVIENNPYLKGAALTLCNDFVGTGPTLKIIDVRLNAKEKMLIQNLFVKWFKEVKLRQKIWQLRIDRLVSGAGYGLKTNRDKNKSGTPLFIRNFECDHVGSPFIPQKNVIDYNGIIVNEETDEPESYYIYKNHPGSSIFGSNMFHDGNWVPAHRVVHWIRKERNWHEGIPEFTPSLPLCALLRRYTLATVLAAETAASITAILTTQSLPNTSPTSFWSGGDSTSGSVNEEALDIFPIEKGMIMQMPNGNTITQMDPKQPTAVYDKFVDALLREIFRPVLVPFNIGSGYSGAFNMASGALDIQLYRTGIANDRMNCNENVMDPIIETWWSDIVLTDAIPASIKIKLNKETPDHSYGWDSVRDEHTDPFKVANAIVTKHKAGIISDEDIQQSLFNRTAEEHYESLTRQQKAREQLGMPVNGTTTTTTDTNTDDGTDDSEIDDNINDDNTDDSENDDVNDADG